MPPVRLLPCVRCLTVAAVVAAVAGTAFLYSGLYPVGADDRHSDLTYWALETLRGRSIARAADDIKVPTDLDSPERLLAGGPDYDEMCSGCHLGPGRTQSDLALGLYPAPPDLAQAEDLDEDQEVQARQRFWIIKHGIKASGMPAWGLGHDDQRIWNMVAFLRRLPQLSQWRYRILTARNPKDAGHH